MAAIEEDYVSFEIAKLLKEKGFDEKCFQYWHEEDNRLIHSQSMHPLQNVSNPCFFGPSAPTLQMAMKWLREVHNLYIEVSLSCDREDKNAKIFDASIFNVQNQRHKKLGNIQGYEQTCEAAIKYCLENLI
jgi:hypothetical protein